jgi:hypothetical protein
MIARHRRDRKSKALPLINTDDTDRKKAILDVELLLLSAFIRVNPR